MNIIHARGCIDTAQSASGQSRDRLYPKIFRQRRVVFSMRLALFDGLRSGIVGHEDERDDRLGLWFELGRRRLLRHLIGVWEEDASAVVGGGLIRGRSIGFGQDLAQRFPRARPMPAQAQSPISLPSRSPARAIPARRAVHSPAMPAASVRRHGRRRSKPDRGRVHCARQPFAGAANIVALDAFELGHQKRDPPGRRREIRVERGARLGEFLGVERSARRSPARLRYGRAIRRQPLDAFKLVARGFAGAQLAIGLRQFGMRIGAPGLVDDTRRFALLAAFGKKARRKRCRRHESRRRVSALPAPAPWRGRDRCLPGRGHAR